MTLGEVCHHGSLARSCLTCEQEREIAELRAERDAATARVGVLEKALEMIASRSVVDARAWCQLMDSTTLLECVVGAIETARTALGGRKGVA